MREKDGESEFPLKNIFYCINSASKFRCWCELKLNILKHNIFSMIALDKERLSEP